MASGGTGGSSPLHPAPQLYYDTNVRRDTASSRSARVTGFQRFVSLELIRLWEFPKLSRFRGSSSDSDNKSVCATKIAANFSAHLLASLPASALWRALFYGFTGHGNVPICHSSIHQADHFGNRSTSWRWYRLAATTLTVDDLIQGTMAALKYEGALFDVFNLEKVNNPAQRFDAALRGRLGKRRRSISFRNNLATCR